jgi:hypothetical protein
MFLSPLPINVVLLDPTPVMMNFATWHAKSNPQAALVPPVPFFWLVGSGQNHNEGIPERFSTSPFSCSVYEPSTSYQHLGVVALFSPSLEDEARARDRYASDLVGRRALNCFTSSEIDSDVVVSPSLMSHSSEKLSFCKIIIQTNQSTKQFFFPRSERKNGVADPNRAISTGSHGFNPSAPMSLNHSKSICMSFSRSVSY